MTLRNKTLMVVFYLVPMQLQQVEVCLRFGRGLGRGLGLGRESGLLPVAKVYLLFIF